MCTFFQTPHFQLWTLDSSATMLAAACLLLTFLP